jgi:lysophospholipase L1-like esterase
MVTVLFTGDSQTCGRNLAIDYPQLLSRRVKARVINTAVGGSNSSALLRPMTGGTLRVAKGDRMVYGTNVRWGMGPFPGMKMTIHGNEYTIDYIHEHPRTPHTEIALLQPAVEDYEGDDYAVEPGWYERVAKYNPDVVCLMYINDGTMPPAKQDDWREMIRRIREMNAVPVLMSPFPIDGEDTGGSHPGENRKYAQNAAAVKALAESEGCWFVDVFNLMFALDPALRGVMNDGIHPDTDGQTVAMNGLMWVFEQMGLPHARPYIKGWVVDAAPPWPVAPLPPMRSFRTSQPDHPTPDRQLTEGFTLDAFIKNDEYRLIAEQDGRSIEFDNAILLEIGFADGLDRKTMSLKLAGTGIASVYAQNARERAWMQLEPSAAEDPVLAYSVPETALSDDGVIRIALAAQEHATLDYVAANAEYETQPAPWKPSESTPRQYPLQSDHDRKTNKLQNPDFIGDKTLWKTTGTVRINRPFSASLGTVAFNDPDDLRKASVEILDRARPFDLITVSGSQAGNNGNYRIRKMLGGESVMVRRKAEKTETGLHGVLHHDDGCGLVPGGACAELVGTAAIAQNFKLPKNAENLRISFFYRAFDPDKTGTRDTPDVPVTLSVDLSGGNRDTPSRRVGWPCSYQWQKADVTIPLSDADDTAEITIAGTGSTTLQVTGIYAGTETPE